MRINVGVLTLVSVVALATGPAATPAEAGFAFGDRDTVVFLGDSNTSAGGYAKVVERYTHLRFPGVRVSFVNAGVGGDTAQGGLARFRRDVLDVGATAVVVVFGVNDICWGACADDAHEQAYLAGIRGIVAASVQAGIRAYVCTYPPVGDPYTGDTSDLQFMTDEGVALAVSLGGVGIDLGRPVRAIQRRLADYNAGLPPGGTPIPMHTGDGVHLNDLGHDAVAWALLKGLGAPAEVSSVTIDAAGPTLVSATGATVTNLQGNRTTLAFTRLDEGLPVGFGEFQAIDVLRWVPFSEDLNQYLLTVRNLPPGNYLIEVDGRSLGTFSDQVLSAGLNITAATGNPWQPGGPWDAQSTLVGILVDARYGTTQVSQLASSWLVNNPKASTLGRRARSSARKIEATELTVGQPVLYQFVLQRVTS